MTDAGTSTGNPQTDLGIGTGLAPTMQKGGNSMSVPSLGEIGVKGSGYDKNTSNFASKTKRGLVIANNPGPGTYKNEF